MAEARRTLFPWRNVPPPPSPPNLPRILFRIWLEGAAYGRSFKIEDLARLGEISVESFMDEVGARWDELEETLEARRG